MKTRSSRNRTSASKKISSKKSRAKSATENKKSLGQLVARKAGRRPAGGKRGATAASSTKRSVLDEIKNDVASLSREFAALATEVKALNEWKHSFANTAEDTESIHRRITVSILKQGPEGFDKVNLAGAGSSSVYEGRLRKLESQAEDFARQVANALIVVNRFESKMGGNSPRDSGSLKSSMGVISDTKPSPVDSNAVGIFKSK